MGTERLLTERSRYTGDFDDDPAAQFANFQVGPCLLAPQQVAVGGPYYTATIDMRGYEKALFCILGGVSGNWDDGLWVEVLQCTAPVAIATGLVAGANAKPIIDPVLLTGKALHDIDALAGGYYGSYSGYYYYNMNRKWLIEVDVEEMDVDNLFRYLQVRYSVGGHPWFLAMEAERSLATFEPCPQTYANQVIA